MFSTFPTNVPFQGPLKILDKVWFFEIYRGYRKPRMVFGRLLRDRNGILCTFLKTSCPDVILGFRRLAAFWRRSSMPFKEKLPSIKLLHPRNIQHIKNLHFQGFCYKIKPVSFTKMGYYSHSKISEKELRTISTVTAILKDTQTYS